MSDEHAMMIGDRVVWCAGCGWALEVPQWQTTGRQDALDRMGKAYRRHRGLTVTPSVSTHLAGSDALSGEGK